MKSMYTKNKKLTSFVYSDYQVYGPYNGSRYKYVIVKDNEDRIKSLSWVKFLFQEKYLCEVLPGFHVRLKDANEENLSLDNVLIVTKHEHSLLSKKRITCPTVTCQFCGKVWTMTRNQTVTVNNYKSKKLKKGEPYIGPFCSKSCSRKSKFHKPIDGYKDAVPKPEYYNLLGNITTIQKHKVPNKVTKYSELRNLNIVCQVCGTQFSLNKRECAIITSIKTNPGYTGPYCSKSCAATANLTNRNQEKPKYKCSIPKHIIDKIRQNNT